MNLANSGRRMSGIHPEAAIELKLPKGAASDPKRTLINCASIAITRHYSGKYIRRLALCKTR